ncbi:hypothetical protein H4Q32_025293 [Labeo rohita]|uniref:ISXO2-like transposase domain-containing protein n=1 Tax=Labeo rohita TaxID=84645 RepID=A0ABQ8L8C9_LABRO|nr:hypothetical protein H4Q32_025293 [Labeo rohita]
MIQDGIAGSSATLSKMTKKLRMVCKKALGNYKRKTGQFVGGRTDMGEEELTKHGEEKSGSLASWLLGGSRNNLIPVITRHVRRGSTILSDEWRPYRRALTTLGYTHYTVNHSRWFVDPVHGGHTQNIERAWSTYKNQVWRLRGNRTEKLLKEHLTCIEWTYWLGHNHRDGPLGRLLKDIRRRYRV